MEIIALRDRPGLAGPAARWFHEKWNIPLSEYQDSIAACLAGKAPVPQWYLILDGDKIAGGAGVIRNDFHDRPDLAPNVCALYVEPAYRCQGLAGQLLAFIRADMAAFGVAPLYLVTDHTSFYERYGWQFVCMAGTEEGPIRLYMHP